MDHSGHIYDCLIIGAGPGGLQAAIHLGRYNRSVLVLDRGGGSTKSAVHIENFLTQENISGQEIVDIGLRQAERFGAMVMKKKVDRLTQENDLFTAAAGEERYQGRTALISTGVTFNFPRIRNMYRFLGLGFYTCVDCDGYRTTGKKLLIAGNSAETIRLAVAMKQMFTAEIAILMSGTELSTDDRELAEEEGFAFFHGEPLEVLGDDRLTGLRLVDGRVIDCEAIMAGFGYYFNDGFLTGLPLDRDGHGNILVNGQGESSLPSLYVVGALRPGNPQAIIAAGQGAVAAIDINRRLLAL